MPVWALLLSIILPTLYVLPSGFICAVIGQWVSFFFFRPVAVLALICAIGLSKRACPDHPRHTIGRKSSSEHGKQSYSLTGEPKSTEIATVLQGVLCTDTGERHIFRTGSKTRPLHQIATTGHVSW